MEKTRVHFLFKAHQDILIQYVENNLTPDHLVQEWRFFVKSEQSYKFFQVFRKSGVVNSISEKKTKRGNLFHDALEFSYSLCRE